MMTFPRAGSGRQILHSARLLRKLESYPALVAILGGLVHRSDGRGGSPYGSGPADQHFPNRSGGLAGAVARAAMAIATAVPLGLLIGSGTPAWAPTGQSVPSVVWGTPTPNPLPSTYDAVSCAPSTSFCVAAGTVGSQVFNGSSWSQASPTLDDITSISCPASGFCVALSRHAADIYSSGSWQSTSVIDPSQQLTSVSCSTTNFCMAVDSAGNYLTYNGTSWGTPSSTSDTNTLTSVSCPTSSFCMAVDSAGNYLTYSGTGWGSPSSTGDTNVLDAVSCALQASQIACLLGDNKGGTMIYNGGSWATGPTTSDTNPIKSVSCLSAYFCMMSDNQGTVLAYDGGSSTLNQTVASGTPLYSISCASPVLCVAVGNSSIEQFSASWSTPAAIDPMWIDSVSCPTSNFCMAVDRSGKAVAYNGTSWGSPSPTGDTNILVSVSCSSSTFCMAVDNHGNALAYNGTTWGSPSAVATSGFESISCVSSSFCIAVDSGADAYEYNGTSWTVPWTNPVVASPIGLLGVSCISANACEAVGTSGSLASFNGSTWTSSSVGDTAQQNAISCASGVCISVDSAGGAAYQFQSGTWTVQSSVFSPNSGNSVSCVADGFCVAGGSGGMASLFAGNGFTVTKNVDGSASLTGVSCWAFEFCVAVDSNGNALRLTNSWYTALFTSFKSPITSVSCAPSATPDCSYVDASGNYNGANLIDPNVHLNSLSCVSSSFCMAVDGFGQFLENNGTGWTLPQSIDVQSLTSVSCPSTSFCMAVDYRGYYSSWTATGGWSMVTSTGDPQTLTSVSCPSSSFCMAVDNVGNAVSWNGTSWTIAAVDSGAYITSVSCTTATFCMAVDNKGNADTFNGSTWTAIPVDTHSLQSVSCASNNGINMCVAVDNAGNAFSFNGTSWSSPTDIDGTAPLIGVSCEAYFYCLAADAAGNYLVGSVAVANPLVSVTPGPVGLAGSTASTYQITFVTSSTGGLTTNSTITISAVSGAPGTVFPTTASDYTVSAGGTPTTASTVSVTSGGAQVAVTVPISISANTNVTVDIYYVTNPSVAGNYALDVSTSSDLHAVATPSYQIATSVVSPTVTLTNTATGQSSTYQVTFMTSSAGALTANNSTITLSAVSSAPGTVFPTTASDYTVSAGGAPTTASTVSVTSGGAQVAVTVPIGIGNSASVTVTVYNVVNPTTAGTYFLYMWTSADQFQTQIGSSYYILSGVSNVTAAVSPNEVSLAATYSVSFTTTSSLTGGSSSITISTSMGAPGTTFPTAASNYTVNGTSVTGVSAGTNQAVITVPSNIPASSLITVVITSVTNPSTANAMDFLQVWTSTDQGEVASNTYPISGSPSQVAITSSPLNIPVSAQATAPIELALEDSSGIQADPLTNTVVTLSASPAGTGTDFSATSGGPAITSITLSTGSPTAVVYFGDTAAGSVTVTASASGLSSGTQVETLNAPPPPKPVSNFSLTLSPSAPSLPPGGTVTFTATAVTTSINQSTGVTTTTPDAGATVSFDISSGPDAGQTASAVTDSSGSATFTYVNSGGPGVDTVTAATANPATGSMVVATSTVTFAGSYSLTLSPVSQGGVATVDTKTVTATLLDPSGKAVVGGSVTFTVGSGPDAGTTQTLLTGSSGTATFSLSATHQGKDVVTATYTVPAAGSTPSTTVISNSADVLWAPPITMVVSLQGGGGGSFGGSLPPAGSITISLTLESPSSALLRQASNHHRAYRPHATMVPDSGIQVFFTVSSGPDSGLSGTVTTDSTGTATWHYSNNGTAGTDTIVASFTDSAGLAHSTSFTATWAAPATTTTTSTTSTTTVASSTTPTGGSTSLQPPPSGATPSMPISPTSPNSPSTTSTTAASSSGKTTETTTPARKPNGSRQALGSPAPKGLSVDGVSNSSNGATAPKAAVEQLVREGQRGPAMPYNYGYGLGPDGGPPGPAPLARSIPTASEAFHTFTKTALGNATLALLLMLLVGFPAIAFNSALKEHHEKLASSRGPVRRFVQAAESRLNALHPVALLTVFSVIGSVLYALDDPTFGLNLSSLAEVVGYIGAIVVSIAATEIFRGVYVHRRFHKIGDLRSYPLGLVIALFFDLFSRISHFEPGYVFGILAAVIFRVPPTGEEDGRSMTYAYIWLFVTGAISWLIYGPVNSAVVHGNHEFWLLVAESLLAYVWVCGLQSLFFALIPARYMDGEVIFKWSKGVWASIYLVATFIFVQFVIHPSAAGYGANTHTKLLPLISIFIVSSVAAGVFWLYAHLKYGRIKSSDAMSEKSSPLP